MMEAFTVLEGVAAPLLRPNINTDIIIRIERLRDFEGAAARPLLLRILALPPRRHRRTRPSSSTSRPIATPAS